MYHSYPNQVFKLRGDVYMREEARVALVSMPLGYRWVGGAACPQLMLMLLDEILLDEFSGGLCC